MVLSFGQFLNAASSSLKIPSGITTVSSFLQSAKAFLQLTSFLGSVIFLRLGAFLNADALISTTGSPSI
jgi:hypothetical protein